MARVPLYHHCFHSSVLRWRLSKVTKVNQSSRQSSSSKSFFAHNPLEGRIGSQQRRRDVVAAPECLARPETHGNGVGGQEGLVKSEIRQIMTSLRVARSRRVGRRQHRRQCLVRLGVVGATDDDRGLERKTGANRLTICQNICHAKGLADMVFRHQLLEVHLLPLMGIARFHVLSRAALSGSGEGNARMGKGLRARFVVPLRTQRHHFVTASSKMLIQVRNVNYGGSCLNTQREKRRHRDYFGGTEGVRCFFQAHVAYNRRPCHAVAPREMSWSVRRHTCPCAGRRQRRFSQMQEEKTGRSRTEQARREESQRGPLPSPLPFALGFSLKICANR